MELGKLESAACLEQIIVFKMIWYMNVSNNIRIESCRMLLSIQKHQMHMKRLIYVWENENTEE